MKALLLMIALLSTAVAQAKTTYFNVFETEKVVASSTTPKNVNFFDFKITKVIDSKTVTNNCRRTGNRDVRDSYHACTKISTTSVEVAQLVVAYNPYGVADRRGDVHNGITKEFVKFNISLDELDADVISTLQERGGLFSSKRKFRALANEMFDLSVERVGNAKFKISLQ